MKADLPNQIKYDTQGLVPAILQDYYTRQVLMLGYMSRESLEKSIATGRCWFYSRSRHELWEKGATSGHYQPIVNITYDCDGDTLLIQVKSDGPVCHTGSRSCFEALPDDQAAAVPKNTFFRIVDQLAAVLHQRNLERPANSYTTKLFNAGTRQIAKKLGEEGVELALAAIDEDDDRFAEEGADLVYNFLVLLESRGLGLDRIGEILHKRAEKKA